ncbi:hypothetical protein [Nonomuraea rubra]|uniref:hypothetical protein n=1 Tax=Nonomuraea rubra TaxID=46180 RepID=UPI0033C64B61
MGVWSCLVPGSGAAPSINWRQYYASEYSGDPYPGHRHPPTLMVQYTPAIATYEGVVSIHPASERGMTHSIEEVEAHQVHPHNGANTDADSGRAVPDGDAPAHGDAGAHDRPHGARGAAAHRSGDDTDGQSGAFFL